MDVEQECGQRESMQCRFSMGDALVLETIVHVCSLDVALRRHKEEYALARVEDVSSGVKAKKRAPDAKS
jgi:hypothetical protein